MDLMLYFINQEIYHDARRGSAAVQPGQNQWFVIKRKQYRPSDRNRMLAWSSELV